MNPGTHRLQCSGGFTLVELMIALLIASLACTGMLQAYALARSGYEQVQRTARLNEQAQYVLTALEGDLQMAGYYGLVSAGDTVDVSAVSGRAASCGDGLVQQLNQAVTISHASYPLQCRAEGGAWLAGTDVLIVRRASASLAQAEAGRLQLLSQLPGDGPSRLVMNGLAPPDCSAGSRCERRDLLVHAYYLAQQADGSSAAERLPALRVKALTRVAGSPAFVDTEVLPGVQNLELKAGYSSGDGAALRYVPSNALPAGARVRAVRLAITLVTARQGRGEPTSLTLTRTFALRNADHA